MRLATRLVIVVVAYAVSCYVAGLVVSVLWATQENPDATGTLYRIFARAIWFGSIVATGALPAFAAIAYAEYAAERRYALYAVCGALAGLLAVLVTTPPDSRLLTMDSAAVLALACVTGLFGASAYWLIAGRNAGIRASRIDQNQPAP